MITPEFLKEAGEKTEKIFFDFQHRLIGETGKQLLEADLFVSDSGRRKTERERRAEELFGAALREISQAKRQSESVLRNLFESAENEIIHSTEEWYRTLEKNGFDRMTAALQEGMAAGRKTTLKKMHRLLDTVAVNSEKEFSDWYDTLCGMVTSGRFSYEEAVCEILRRLGTSGVSVWYPGGRKKTVDSAMKQTAMTGLNETVGRMSEQICDDLECDLVEVTAHRNARPSHAEWQGKVYSRSGTNPSYPDFAICGYGTGEGLLGWNCYHSFHPFFEGISERIYTDEQLEELKNRTVCYQGNELSGYEAAQKQRVLERKNRESRRTAAAYDGGIRYSSGTLKRELEICRAAEIRRLDGLNRELARLTKGLDGGKIKEQVTKKITRITDDVIQKVKKVEINGFNDKQNDYIHNQHKELLKYARDNNESKEVAFVFRKDLSDKMVFVGSDDELEFGNGLFGKGDGMFIMHNHPGNSSFSSTDVAQLIVENNIGSISVVKNNGNIEVITKTDIYDQRKAVIEWNRATKNITEGTDAEYKNAMKQLLKTLEKGGYIKWTK